MGSFVPVSEISVFCFHRLARSPGLTCRSLETLVPYGRSCPSRVAQKDGLDQIAMELPPLAYPELRQLAVAKMATEREISRGRGWKGGVRSGLGTRDTFSLNITMAE